MAIKLFHNFMKRDVVAFLVEGSTTCFKYLNFGH